MIDLGEIFPVVAAPHHVDNVKAVSEVEGTKIQQALIGTCTNGRLEDLRQAAAVLRGKKLPKYMQMQIIPASKEIYMQAMKEGLIGIFIEAGANVLSSSCGPCLGTGQGFRPTASMSFPLLTVISKEEWEITWPVYISPLLPPLPGRH